MDKNTFWNRHRHFVAFPLFLLIAVVSGSVVSLAHSDVLSQQDMQYIVAGEHEEFAFPSGVHGIVYNGFVQERAERVRLHRGSLIVKSHGTVVIEVPGAILAGMDGAMFVSLDESSIIVAAISTPIVVWQKSSATIIPAGMQWKLTSKEMAGVSSGFSDWMADRSPSKIPEAFLKRQLADISTVSVPEFSLPASKGSMPEDSSFTNLLLPAAKVKQRRMQTEHLLGYVRNAVETGEAEVLSVLVGHESLTSERGSNVLTHLLSEVELSSAAQMQLLSLLAQDEILWTVASFHPRYLAAAWTMFGPESSEDLHLSRVILFPWSTLAADEVPPLVFERFSEEMHSLIEKEPELLKNMVAVHVPIIRQLEDAGYPKRAAHLRSIYRDLLGTARLPEEVVDRLRSELEYVSDVPELPSAPTSSEEPEDEEDSLEDSLPPEQIEQMVYEKLSKAGALFSTETTVSSYEPNEARVSRILFAGPSEDREVSFTINVATNIVSGIELNGETGFPFSPTFEGFIQWITR